jgi:hypothetical protein
VSRPDFERARLAVQVGMVGEVMFGVPSMSGLH